MKPALLVIDVQNEYFPGGKLPVTYPAGSMEKILKAMDEARVRKVPVIAIQHSNPAGAAAFAAGSAGWKLHPEIGRRECSVIMEKTLPGSFTGTGLEAWLRDHEIDTVVIAGYMTQMCCDTTARQAMHLGFKVVFLSDATGTLAFSNSAGSVSAETLHTTILVVQQARFSTVMDTDSWLKSFARP